MPAAPGATATTAKRGCSTGSTGFNTERPHESIDDLSDVQVEDVHYRYRAPPRRGRGHQRISGLTARLTPVIGVKGPGLLRAAVEPAGTAPAGPTRAEAAGPRAAGPVAPPASHFRCVSPDRAM